ncbi:MAG TPA: outer membrane beta-barrel protein [Polyangiaceae bacterium]|nr:outer membrane beta-barrel protein [Polyangiaceae bacterium]
MARRLRTTLPALSGLLAAATAFVAFESRAIAFEFGAGLMGVAGGNFQNKPDRRPTDPNNNPGFGGTTVGGGLMLDGRVLDGLLGLEVDVLRTTDSGGGDVTVNGVTGHVKISQGAWHVPILFKLTIPSPVVAPMFFVGPEIVAPGSHDGSVDGPFSAVVTVHSKSDTYTMLTLGGGVEIKLPLPILDLRIPIGLRLSYNPGLSDKYADRTTNTINATGTSGDVTYSSEMKYAVSATLGAALYF